MKPKPAIQAEHAINWYAGNCLLNPNNAVRNKDLEKPDAWRQEIEDLKKELSGRRMTHKEMLELMKERGIHSKYYKYRKYLPPYCECCARLGFPR